MLPLDNRNGRYAPHRRRSSYGGDRSLPEYFARLVDFKQVGCCCVAVGLLWQSCAVLLLVLCFDSASDLGCSV
jgi:hypothetical protein